MSKEKMVGVKYVLNPFFRIILLYYFLYYSCWDFQQSSVLILQYTVVFKLLFFTIFLSLCSVLMQYIEFYIFLQNILRYVGYSLYQSLTFYSCCDFLTFIFCPYPIIIILLLLCYTRFYISPLPLFNNA